MLQVWALICDVCYLMFDVPMFGVDLVMLVMFDFSCFLSTLMLWCVMVEA